MRTLRILLASLLLTSPAVAAPFDAARTITGEPFVSTNQVTIVHYWATWCAPCRLEMPILDAYYRKHHGQGLNMLAVSIDQGVPKRKLRDATVQFTFPVASIDDVKMPRRDIPAGIPVNRIYDRTDRLVFQTKGDGRTTVDMATLERVVTPLLNKR